MRIIRIYEDRAVLYDGMASVGAVVGNSRAIEKFIERSRIELGGGIRVTGTLPADSKFGTGRGSK